MKGTAAISVIEAFDAAWNAHDEPAVVGYFADDVVITISPAPPPPLRPVSRGKAEAAEFVRALMPGFSVASRHHQVAGDRVTWHFTVAADGLRRLGADPATGTAAATVRGSMIETLGITFSPETVAQMAAAQVRAGV